MEYKKKNTDALNFLKSELKNERNNKMDKTINISKITFINKLIKILQ